MKKKHLIFIALIPTLLWFLFIYYKTGILFETNDDRYISEILSGVLTGNPEAHTSYVNYLLCLPLTLLYRITGAVSWYGIMLLLSQIICYTLFFYILFRRWNYYSLPFYFGILIAGIYISSLTQYTSTAALLAIVGYVCLYSDFSPKTKHVMFFLLELFAFLLRYQAMLMIQPLGLLVFLSLQLTGQMNQAPKMSSFFSSVFLKKFLRQCLIPFLIILATISIGTLGNRIGYRTSEWKEYIRYNNSRTELFDFYGAPNYDIAQSILDRYHVTENEYIAFCNFTILENNISADCLEELASLSKAQYLEANSTSSFVHIINCFTDSLSEYFGNNYWNLNKLLITVWIFLVVAIIVSGKMFYFIPCIGLFFGRTISWIYLLYRSRVPARVAIPLLLCELIFLITILSHVIPHTKKTPFKKTYIVLIICSIAFLYVSFNNGISQYRYIKQQNEAQTLYDQSFLELQNYCLEHPENRYLIEAQSLAYYKGSVLSTAMYQPRNSLVTGCWYSASPAMKNTINEYLDITSNADKHVKNPLYFIITADASANEPILNYISEYTQCPYALIDKFTVSHGGTYLVYCFQ